MMAFNTKSVTYRHLQYIKKEQKIIKERNSVISVVELMKCLQDKSHAISLDMNKKYHI